MLEEHLGVRLPKLRRLQRSDWTLRPLSDESLSYAAGDVLHLARLRGALAERLHRLGRTRWLREECERLEQVRHSEPDHEAASCPSRAAARSTGVAWPSCARSAGCATTWRVSWTGRPSR